MEFSEFALADCAQDDVVVRSKSSQQEARSFVDSSQELSVGEKRLCVDEDIHKDFCRRKQEGPSDLVLSHSSQESKSSISTALLISPSSSQSSLQPAKFERYGDSTAEKKKKAIAEIKAEVTIIENKLTWPVRQKVIDEQKWAQADLDDLLSNKLPCAQLRLKVAILKVEEQSAIWKRRCILKRHIDPSDQADKC